MLLEESSRERGSITYIGDVLPLAVIERISYPYTIRGGERGCSLCSITSTIERIRPSCSIRVRVNTARCRRV
jgi:hypothetical protein